MDLCLGLTLFLAGFALWAAVGHGVWVVARALLKAATPPEERPPPAVRPHGRDACPDCRAQLGTFDRTCPRCGLNQSSRLADDLDRLRTAEREVHDLAVRSELDPATTELVAARLDARVRALRTDPALPVRRARVVGAADRPVVAALPLAPDAPADEAPVRWAAHPVSGRPRVEPAQGTTAHGAGGPPDRPGVLTAFMEEKNILWGELVGGVLIVGCSIALVLSVWKQLEELPYFPFLLAAGITAALFGAGQYTLHHWKLAATSRGLLVISMLLAPLNLLLLAHPGTAAATGWLDIGVKAAAAVLFVGMVRAGGRDLIGTDLLPNPVNRRWLLALAVVGAPASQALPADWTEGGAAGVWLPMLCHVGACAAVLAGLTWYRPRAGRGDLSGPQGSAVLTFVGLSLFALLAAWGLLLTRSPDLPATLMLLALPLAVAGVPVAEAGLVVQKRAADPILRTAGTVVALAGSLLLSAGVGLAWPDPLGLMLVAAVVGAVFTRVAWRDGLTGFHAGAVPALGFAAVLAVHGLLGHWPPAGTEAGEALARLLDSSTTGVTLAGFALVLARVAEAAVRGGHRAQAAGYALGGSAAAAAGLFLVNVHGVREPWPAAGVHAACALGLLAANVRWRHRAAAHAGVWLLLAATLWTLAAARPDGGTGGGAWGCAVALEAVGLAAVALALTRAARAGGPAGVVFAQLRGACRDVAAAAGLLAVGLAVATPGFPRGQLHTVTFLALAAAGVLLARLFVRPWPTWAGSAALLAGLIHLTVVTAEVKPVAAAVLLGLLGHATVALAGAALLWGRPRGGRLFADPLRWTAFGTAALAGPLLLAPPAGLAPEWAGLAAGLAAV